MKGVLSKMRGIPNAVAELFKQQASLLFDSSAKHVDPMEAIPVTTGFIGRLEKGLKHQVDLLQSGVVSSPLPQMKGRSCIESKNEPRGKTEII